MTDYDKTMLKADLQHKAKQELDKLKKQEGNAIQNPEEETHNGHKMGGCYECRNDLTTNQ
jgi:hypothetical protein